MLLSGCSNFSNKIFIIIIERIKDITKNRIQTMMILKLWSSLQSIVVRLFSRIDNISIIKTERIIVIFNEIV